MELVVWQLFVGATAAEPSSEVRSWFITRLREVSYSMTGLGQGVVIGTLTYAFTPDARLLQRFAVIWQEVFSSSYRNTII